MQYAGSCVGGKGSVKWGAKNLPTNSYFTPKTVQPLNSCYSNYDIMALLDVVTGAVFIVDAFNVDDIFLSLPYTLAKELLSVFVLSLRPPS
jgi:hypothetical protein